MERERIHTKEKTSVEPGLYLKHCSIVACVFQDWDKGKANETFPQHSGGAVLLDSIGFWEDYSLHHPEKLLDFSDWMGIPIRPQKIDLSRFKRLLIECAQQLYESGESGVS